MHFALTPLSPALTLRGLAMLASLAPPAVSTAPAALAAGFLLWIAAFVCRFDAYYQVLRRLDDGSRRPAWHRGFMTGSITGATTVRGIGRGWRP
jgi:hypothetical protein